MKHGIKTIAGAVTAAIFAVFAFGCAPTGIWRIKQITDVVSLHTELQKDYLADGYNNIAEYANGVEELSRPAPVLLEWEYENANAKKYVLEVSRYENFVKPIKIATAEPRAEVYNLETGAEYFWRVRAGRSVSPVSSFTTAAAAPRNLYVDGVTNVRDLGGWSTWDGQTVKQGMIIRCGRLNKSETPEVEIEITDDGIAFMRDVLDVATEIDLRMPDAHNTETGGITQSPLGADVNYINIPMEWVMGNSFDYLTDTQYYPAIRRFFEVASNINNYPIIYHCNIGTDRTGLYAFLINGLLGVTEQDLYRDYLFSNFGNIGGARSVSNIKAYVNKIKEYAGDTFDKQVENCLLDIGVEQAHIDAVKRIML